MLGLICCIMIGLFGVVYMLGLCDFLGIYFLLFGMKMFGLFGFGRFGVSRFVLVSVFVMW